MKLLSETKSLVKEFKSLMNSYNHYTWAVAWAGDVKDFELSDSLAENKEKIDKIVVGLHFYQTAPSFICKFMGDNGVRFIKRSDGIFHSKVYLFWNDENDWKAIIGSSNFTKAGFGSNTETNVVIDNSDGGRIIFNEIYRFIAQLWKKADRFDEKDFETYNKNWIQHKPQINSLEKMPKSGGSVARIIEDPLESWDWDTYVKRIKHEPDGSLENRIRLLHEAHLIFSRKKTVLNMSDDEKRKIGGYDKSCDSDNIDWKFFGTAGNGEFMHSLNINGSAAKAIDGIPLEGEITKDDVTKYFRTFRKDLTKEPIASATRLLALKRPDIFVSIDSANRKELCRSLGITLNSINLENYWDVVISPIMKSVWFQVPLLNVRREERVYKCYQVALLDAAFYNRKK